MKIVAATDAFFVGEGYQTLPCPYVIFPALPKSIFSGNGYFQRRGQPS
jgi:hypothetical protein